MHKPGEVLKVGHWIYDDTTRCRVEIQFSNIRYGSGDYEDQPEWRDDQLGEWYVVSYSSPIDPDKCPPNWKVSQGEPTLSEAIHKVESTLRDCKLKWET